MNVPQVYELLNSIWIPSVAAFFTSSIALLGIRNAIIDKTNAKYALKKSLKFLAMTFCIVLTTYTLNTAQESLTVLNTALLFFGLMAFFIETMKSFSQLKKEEQTENKKSVLIKKYAFADLSNYRFSIANIGVLMSLFVVLTAMEFPTFEPEKVVIWTLDAQAEDTPLLPPTVPIEQPKPPKVVVPKLTPVPDDKAIDEIDIEIPDFIEDLSVDDFSDDEFVEPIEEFVEPFVLIAEKSAVPEMGMTNYLKWVAKNIDYPSQARRMGVEGKVYVQFIVEKDGSVSQIQIARGIGGGCDEEAIRVIKKAPKWTPASQRGRSVRQRLIIPINFKMN
ncbi:energy transducer TonB [Sediminitomix flava]|uniref:TonB family protein n=1 Tax=Sediminitomix flava TaxID=379075 RepID=A0A315ZGC7_SEDFL|nr:energy transducer TonB [Sediminitomix flava]PWJ44170.1 TonB family protein [Sediminitomix flava]